MALWISPAVCNAAPSVSTVNYTGIESLIGWIATLVDAGNCVGCDGSGVTITDWTVNVAVAPGVGKSWVFDLGTNVAGVFTASGISVTIVDTAVTGNSGGTSVTFNAGDLLVVRCTPSGTPTATGKVDWCQYRTSTNQPMMTGITNLSFVQVSTRTLAPTHGGQSATQPNEPRPLPHDVTVGNIYCRLSADPGNGKVVTITLMKKTQSSGYAPGSGSATAAVITITGNGSNSVTGSYTGTRISFSAGDLISFQTDGTAGMTSTCHLFIGYDFVPNTLGDCAFLLECVPAEQSTTYYIWGANGKKTTEADTNTAVYPCTAKNFVGAVCSSSGVYSDIPNTRTMACTVRKNASSSGSPTWTCTGAGGANAQYKSDFVTTLAFARGDLIDFQSVTGASAGADCSVHYGLTLSVDQTVAGQPTGRRLGALGQVFRPIEIGRRNARIC